MQLFVGRLEVTVLEARGIKPCLEPCIVCLYDHSKAALICRRENDIREAKNGDLQSRSLHYLCKAHSEKSIFAVREMRDGT